MLLYTVYEGNADFPCVLGAIIEYHGPGVNTLSATGMGTIASTFR